MITQEEYIQAGIPLLASNCNHKEKEIKPGLKVCMKCKRYRVVFPKKELFFYLNGVKYFTKKLKEETK